MPAATPELDALADKLLLPNNALTRNALQSRADVIEIWVMTAWGGMKNTTLQTYEDGFYQQTGERLTPEDIRVVVESALNYRLRDIPRQREQFIQEYQTWMQQHLPPGAPIPLLRLQEVRQSTYETELAEIQAARQQQRAPPETPESQLLPDYEATPNALETEQVPAPQQPPPQPPVQQPVLNPPPNRMPAKQQKKALGDINRSDPKAIATRAKERGRERTLRTRQDTRAFILRDNRQGADGAPGMDLDAPLASAARPRALVGQEFKPQYPIMGAGQAMGGSHHGHSMDHRVLDRALRSYRTTGKVPPAQAPTPQPLNLVRDVTSLADRGPGGTDNGRDDTKPWKQRPNQGAYTNAPRPAYPKVFRPYGSNTRQRVVGDRSSITHMHHGGYAKGIVESMSSSSLLPSHCPLGQSGASAVVSHVPAFRPGSSHLLFSSR